MNDEEIERLSLLGRMMRAHILLATPVLYHKPQVRWPLILLILILAILVLGRAAP